MTQTTPSKPRSYSKPATQAEHDFYRAFVAQLKAKRKQLGMSEDALGRLIGVSDRLVFKWENSTRYPGSFSLCCWAMALGVRMKIEDV